MRSALGHFPYNPLRWAAEGLAVCVRGVQAEDLTEFGELPRKYLDDDDGAVVELSEDPVALRKFLGLVLVKAVEYRASSIHYHTWRLDGGLAHIVANVRYVPNPAPASLAERIVAAARSLFVSEGPVNR
jgi:hypothetical protein